MRQSIFHDVPSQDDTPSRTLTFGPSPRLYDDERGRPEEKLDDIAKGLEKERPKAKARREIQEEWVKAHAV